LRHSSSKLLAVSYPGSGVPKLNSVSCNPAPGHMVQKNDGREAAAGWSRNAQRFAFKLLNDLLQLSVHSPPDFIIVCDAATSHVNCTRWAGTSESAQRRAAEFVLTDAKRLAGVTSDSVTFAEHLESSSKCGNPPSLDAGHKDHGRSFFNLGGDARLVAPCNSGEASEDAYAHLAAFTRGASKEQVAAVLRLVVSGRYFTGERCLPRSLRPPHSVGVPAGCIDYAFSRHSCQVLLASQPET
jgi:hypothetical protein